MVAYDTAQPMIDMKATNWASAAAETKTTAKKNEELMKDDKHA